MAGKTDGGCNILVCAPSLPSPASGGGSGRGQAGKGALFLVLSGWASSASAHHAFAAEFDANRPVNFKGTITKMEWVNPHTWLHVDVKNADGTVVNWAIEAGTPNVLFRRGFTKDSLVPGTEIAVDGYQSKDGTNRANGRDLTFPDGRKLFLGSSGTGAPYELTPGAAPKTQ